MCYLITLWEVCVVVMFSIKPNICEKSYCEVLPYPFSLSMLPLRASEAFTASLSHSEFSTGSIPGNARSTKFAQLLLASVSLGTGALENNFVSVWSWQWISMPDVSEYFLNTSSIKIIRQLFICKNLLLIIPRPYLLMMKRITLDI